MEKNNEEIVYQKLKNAIIKRYIKQGTKLVETTLAKQLQVSRTPVRGAIRRLVYNGFATYEPNKGACVIEPTKKEIQETFFVRRQLEGAAAELAAQNISASRLEQLDNYLKEEIRVTEERDLNEYYRINDEFHLGIARASENTVLIRYIEEVLNRTKVYLILFDPFFSMPFNPSLHEHQKIVDALKAHDPVQTRKEMEIHLKSAFWVQIKNPLPDDYISL